VGGSPIPGHTILGYPSYEVFFNGFVDSSFLDFLSFFAIVFYLPLKLPLWGDALPYATSAPFFDPISAFH
jgi:hypothetical protein